MAMNKVRRTSNINNIVTYDSLGNVTLPANLTVKAFIAAGFVKTDANGLLSVDTTIYQAALPSQTGNAGKYLTTNGSVLSWGTVSTINIYEYNGTLTGNRTVALGSNSLTFLKTIAVVTNAEGLDIKNDTASTVSNNSYSPSLTFSGFGWGGTGANTLSRIRQYLVPVSGSPWNLPTLKWDGWNAYGDWVNLMTLKAFNFGGGTPYGGLTVGSVNINTTQSQIDNGNSSASLVFVNANNNGGIKLQGGSQYIEMKGSTGISFHNGTNEMGRFYTATGNLLIQTGGTFTDAGYKLDVNGTARVSGLLTTGNLIFGENTSSIPTTLQNTNKSMFLWNLTGGGGELDLVINSVVGGTGLNIYRYSNAGVATQLAGIYTSATRFYTNAVTFDGTGTFNGNLITNSGALRGGYLYAEGNTNLIVTGVNGTQISWNRSGFEGEANYINLVNGTFSRGGDIEFGKYVNSTTTYTSYGGWKGNGSFILGSTTSLASAILQVDSTTKGFLPPRMTSTQRDAIATPATGLSIYNTTTLANNTYNGTSWLSEVNLTAAGRLLLGGATESTFLLDVNGTGRFTGDVTITGILTADLTSTGLTGGANLYGTSMVTRPTVNSGITWGGGNVFINQQGIFVPTFSGSATFQSSNYAAQELKINRITFAAASSTITMTQASGGIRAFSNAITHNYIDGTNNGTISHFANIAMYGDYAASTAKFTFTNRYGLLINDFQEFAQGHTYTNRWAIYQDGASDNNYFKGKVIIGSTNTVGASPLNVKGLPTSAAGLSTGDVWNNSGVLNIV